jgi:fucose permease
VVLCFIIFLKLGWVAVASLFLTYFFMSIMFPTIFALGIFGFGDGAKKASSFIVMAIMGGAILPKVMGWVADKYDLPEDLLSQCCALPSSPYTGSCGRGLADMRLCTVCRLRVGIKRCERCV